MPTEHPADKRPGQGTVGAKDVRLRDLRTLKWSSHLTQGWDTTDNLLGFMTRPWFSTVVAGAALLNCFLLVLPVRYLVITPTQLLPARAAGQLPLALALTPDATLTLALPLTLTPTPSLTSNPNPQP